MSKKHHKIHTKIIHFSTVFFAFALVWFAIVYYPNVLNQNSPGEIKAKALVLPVIASGGEFPIETEAFKISHDEQQNSYYIYIKAKSLEQFVINKSAARLSLKNSLSVENLCGLEAFYFSLEGLTVPKKYLTDNC